VTAEVVVHRSWSVAFQASAETRFLTYDSDEIDQATGAHRSFTIEALMATSGMLPHGLLVATYYAGPVYLASHATSKAL
jgi:hypothetical protein